MKSSGAASGPSRSIRAIGNTVGPSHARMVAAFNALAAQMRLGVTDELTNNQANVNVIAQAKMSPGRSDGYLVWSHGTTAKNRNTANRTR